MFQDASQHVPNKCKRTSEQDMSSNKCFLNRLPDLIFLTVFSHYQAPPSDVPGNPTTTTMTYTTHSCKKS